MSNASHVQMKYLAGVGMVAFTGLLTAQDVTAMPAASPSLYNEHMSATTSNPQWERASSSRPSLVDSFGQLRELAQLGPNWDSYGAEPLTGLAIAAASTLIGAVSEDRQRVVGHGSAPWMIAPAPDGGVQVEWMASGRKIEVVVNPDGTFSYLIVDNTADFPAYIEEHGVSLDEVRQRVESLLLA